MNWSVSFPKIGQKYHLKYGTSQQDVSKYESLDNGVSDDRTTLKQGIQIECEYNVLASERNRLEWNGTVR